MEKVQIVEQWSLSGVRRWVRGADGKLRLLDEAPNLIAWNPRPEGLECDLTQYRRAGEEPGK